jgi:general secretion pathway protein F
MPTFTYKAKKTNGQVVSGVLVEESRHGVMDRLLRMGLTPMELIQESESTVRNLSGKISINIGKRIKKSEIGNFMRQLGDLLNAGVPLVRALTTLENQQSNPQLKTVIHQIKSSVVSGSNLAEAMEQFPRHFTELQINLVKSGEISGNLETVLCRLAEFTEKELQLMSRVKTALAYPALLFIVGIGAVSFLLTFFIPKFAVIFADMGQTLPAPTRILMAISHIARTTWYLWVVGFGGVLYGFQLWIQTSSGRYQFDGWKLKIPVVRELVTRMAVSRFCRTLGTLLKSGVPLLAALKVVKGAAGNAVISREIVEIAGSIREGQSLAEPLRMSHVFPPAVVEMVAVGEEAGNLEEVLFKISEAYETEVDNAVRIFVSLLEPAMILFMAGIVGFIVVSMLLPVFSLNSMIK